MTTKGYGPPLDALDAVCKAYKALGLIKLTILNFELFSHQNFLMYILHLLKRFLNPSQDCVNCVTDKFGDQCIGEIVSYDYKSWLR